MAIYNSAIGHKLNLNSMFGIGFISILMFVSLPAIAQLKIAYIDVPPFAFQDENQQPTGLLIEAFHEITMAIEREAEFIHLPHRRLIDFIEQGRVDVWAGQINSQVGDELALVSSTPLFVMDLHIYWQKGSPPVDSFADLEGKQLVLVSSYSYGGNLARFESKSAGITFVINHEIGFDTLFSRQDNYLLGYKRISEVVINKYGLSDLEQTPLAQYKLYLKISKAHPEAAEIMQQIDAFLLTKH